MDELTQRVLQVQAGEPFRREVEKEVLLRVFEHLRNYHRNDEDEVSAFLVEFASKIGGLVDRFRERGVPFQHYVMRSMRWQWTSFKARRERDAAYGLLLAEPRVLDYGGAEQGVSFDRELEEVAPPVAPLAGRARKTRLLRLALKQARYLDEAQVEELSRLASVDHSWLEAQLEKVRGLLEPQVERQEALAVKQSEAYWARLTAEQQARREPDPERRALWDKRAALYRARLTSLHKRRSSVTVAPTHLDLARLLGLPKGTVDSGIFHLKKELASLYTEAHDSSGDEQRPQERRTRASAARRPARPSR